MITAKTIAIRLKMTEDKMMPVKAPVFTVLVPFPEGYMSASFTQ
jgi:hypothetical protein